MAKKKAKTKKRETFVVGVDLGGTKILAAVVDQQGKILAEVKRPTKPESGAEKIVQRIAETVHVAMEKSGVSVKRVAAVGVGAPAPIDPETGFVFHAPNIPTIRDFPLGERLRDVLGMPVYVDNDVNAGTVGEHVLGAGRGTRDMVGIFVGTGVGGGVIVDGRLRHGFRNSAGEVGHMVVGFQGTPDEAICGCGRPGCLEAYASRTAIEREIQAAIAAGRETLVTALFEQSGRDRLTSGVLATALEQGDLLVTEVIERATAYLAVLVASIVNFFDPEVVVIGGGVAEALDERLLAPLREKARYWFIKEEDAHRVRIVAAELGDYAGVLGAAMIARQNVL
jgi:glucokinase